MWLNWWSDALFNLSTGMGSRSWTRSRMPTTTPDSLNSLLIWSNYNTYWNGTLYCLPAPSEYLRSSQHAILNTDVWYYLFSSMVCISLLLNSVHVCVVFHLLMRYIEYQDGFCIVGLLLHWIYRVSLQLLTMIWPSLVAYSFVLIVQYFSFHLQLIASQMCLMENDTFCQMAQRGTMYMNPFKDRDFFRLGH